MASDHIADAGEKVALRELLERVRAAKGPDRDIDAAICALLDPPVIMEHWLSITPRKLDPAKWRAGWRGYVHHIDWWHDFGQGNSQSRRYTGSIDAALALLGHVLPDWTTRHHQAAPDRWHFYVCRHVADQSGVHGPHEFKGIGTPPISIVIATLSALVEISN